MAKEEGVAEINRYHRENWLEYKQEKIFNDIIQNVNVLLLCMSNFVLYFVTTSLLVTTNLEQFSRGKETSYPFLLAIPTAEAN